MPKLPEPEKEIDAEVKEDTSLSVSTLMNMWKQINTDDSSYHTIQSPTNTPTTVDYTKNVWTMPTNININNHTSAVPNTSVLNGGRIYSGKTWHVYDDISTHYTPKVSKYDDQVQVVTDEGDTEVISRDELIKYIRERELVKKNDLVRKMYERYQVAVKLVRSDDDGDSEI